MSQTRPASTPHQLNGDSPDTRERILVLRYRFIGDTLLTIPFLHSLRRIYPHARIDLYVGADAADLMALCPFLDNVVVFEPRKQGFWQAVKQIRKARYHKAYVIKRSFSSALMTWLAGIPQRIGFNTEGRGFLLTRGVPYKGGQQHEAQCYLDLLNDDNTFVELEPPQVSAWLPPSAREKARSLLAGLSQGGPLILLHATSTNPAKCWPPQHFQTLSAGLVQSHQARFLFLGPPADHPVVEQLIAGMLPEAQSRAHNLCGQTTLVESMAMLDHVDLVVANDSGMIHMAAAMSRPVVALFGPMDPVQWQPLSQNATIVVNQDLLCRPCRMKITCDHRYPCMVELMPNKVLNLCKLHLKSWNGPAS